jgi:hypothetical protein
VGSAAVAATAGARAWVFLWGEYAALGTTQLAAVEWTGTSWSAMHNFAASPSLSTAIASGPNDVWGFGTTGSRNQTPWAVHYNGKSWSQVSIPVIPSQASGSAAAGDWVTGTVAAQPKLVELLHWSKGAWRNVVLPKIAVPNGDQMFPGAVDAATVADIWVTVSVGPSAGRGPVTAVLLHWNGKAWSKAAVPKGVSLSSVASDGHGGAWMAADGVASAIYHYSGGRWTHVPDPVRADLQSDLELIPGTRSVLATAELSGYKAAILKYGS